MDCHLARISWQPFALCGLLLLSCTSAAHADAVQPSPITRAFRHDATLNDIAFINPSTGWAVGDRGVIWHTANAGATWQQQTSPVSCPLNAVFFIDSRHGWAVGGQCQPYTNATRGVVLRTDDGGATWRQLPQPLLPLLTGIKFFDHENGIAFGHRASYYPSGVFTTRDGGVTWQPIPADQPGGWLAGDFLEPDAGALAGPAGQVATLARRKIIASPLAATSLRSVRAMRLIAPTGGWAVGDGGLVLTTNDLGRSWQTPPANPLERPGDTLSDHFDFQAVAVDGPHIWIAGTPGTRIFHSPDSGKSWHAAPTGQSVPLRTLRFIDGQHGWAAGALGNILTTHDGGQTWQAQRSGAQRAALLAIFPNPNDVPLELLADAGAADGYIAAVDILSAPSTAAGDVASTTGDSHRTHEALLLAGAASANTAWRFPIPSADLALAPEDLLEALNRENDGRALQQLESHIVRELRMWRPDVVVLPHIPTADEGGWGRATASPQQHLAMLIERLVAQSIESAADPARHPELASEIGLAPWQVKKVYGLTPSSTHGEESIESTRFSAWLGATLAVFASPARSLLFTEHTPPPNAVELKLLINRVTQNSQARGIFSGISLAHGSEARRPQPDPPVQDVDALRRLATRRRNIEQLLQRTQGNDAWAAQVNEMIDGLSDDDSGQLLVQLAEGYRKAGRLDLAADTYFLFARRTPDHPLVDPALNWLVQFYASSEIAHRLASRSATNIRTPAAPTNDGTLASPGLSLSKPAAASGDATSSREIQQTSALTAINSATPPAIALARDDRLRRAIQLADYLKTTRHALYAEPAVRFAEVGAHRKLGFANPAKRFFLALRQLPETDPWRQCAATEEWLDKPGDEPPPKKLATCRRANAPPQLDGQLNEPFWNTNDRIFLRNSDSASRPGEGQGEGSDSAHVRITRDNEFLYLAIRCPKAANVVYQPDDSARPRDDDLTRHDRVSLRFDVDRDFTTAFELTVDSRGRTRDACWGDRTWDPAWYVAAASDETSWTVEAAIPLADLCDKPPAARDVWALAICRTIPRTGYQTWAPAETRGEATSENSPAQYGLLIFE